jgi:DNA-binding transcriptional MerR regulator
MLFMDFTPYIGERRYDKILELCERLMQKVFIGTDTGVPYRSINHWEKIGLIDDEREDANSWRRFSFVEFIWIRMIDEMRKVGLPMDTIKAVKASLFYPASIVDLDIHLRSIYQSNGAANADHEAGRKAMENDMRGRFNGGFEEQQVDGNWLQQLILSSIVKRCPVILVVFTNGTPYAIHEEPENFIFPEHLDRLSFETHVRIPITGIIKEFLIGGRAIERMGDLQILQPNELTVLRIIQSGVYDSVTVNFKDQKMKSLELRKSQDVTRKIVDVLASGKYQDISITQHKGQIMKIENTIKFKFQG